MLKRWRMFFGGVGIDDKEKSLGSAGQNAILLLAKIHTQLYWCAMQNQNQARAKAQRVDFYRAIQPVSTPLN